eukprot:gene21683-biopygen19056
MKKLLTALALAPMLLAGALAHAQAHNDKDTKEDIARHRACSVSTVRWHLKSVFAKLGISRQAELVRLFTAGMA